MFNTIPSEIFQSAKAEMKNWTISPLHKSDSEKKESDKIKHFQYLKLFNQNSYKYFSINFIVSTFPRQPPLHINHNYIVFNPEN